jgi:selT/selW/selH-like putative selenoprotein
VAEELKAEIGVESELVTAFFGVFVVEVDGKVIYEKSKKGRFPKKGELVELLKKET